MQRLAFLFVLIALIASAQEGPMSPPSPASSQQQPNPAPSVFVTIPAGTKVALALTRPVWKKSAKAGDPLYAESVFPVAVDNQMAIPPGTYVEGKIDVLTRPGWLSPHAELLIHFTKLIFANSYTVLLNDAPVNPSAPTGQSSISAPPVSLVDAAAAFADVHVQVSSAGSVLLDNGSQIEMVLQSPLALNAGNVANAVRVSKPVSTSQFKSAVHCVPTPGTPGTPDTVIPGTPSIPGTPPTVIPGGPGMPPTIIPGTPEIPGTAPTVIPGTPSTPGTSCPGPPIVSSQPSSQEVHTHSLQVDTPLTLAGQLLAPGKYQFTWTGIDTTTRVDILLKGKHVATIPARVVVLAGKPSADSLTTRTNPDGSISLRSLQFAGEISALIFDPVVTPIAP